MERKLKSENMGEGLVHKEENLLASSEPMLIYEINLFQTAGNECKRSFNLNFYQYYKSIVIKSK